jgi:hypothetical protein
MKKTLMKAHLDLIIIIELLVTQMLVTVDTEVTMVTIMQTILTLMLDGIILLLVLMA